MQKNQTRAPEHAAVIYGVLGTRENLLGYLKGEERQKQKQINRGDLAAGMVKNLQVHVEACKQLQATVKGMSPEAFKAEYAAPKKAFNVEMELHKAKQTIEAARLADEADEGA
jgi:hypothetical protein